jgi:5-methylcytosine-specific restriction endonuclease McrA
MAIFLRKYCSPDCQRVYVKSISRNRRESIPADVRGRVYSKYKETCFYCGDYGDCIDHIVPIAKGGRTADDNLVLACKSCNSAAGSRKFHNIEEKKKFILEKRGIIESRKDDADGEFIRPSWHAFVYSGKKRK